MGTRGTYGFYAGGKPYLAYVQFDSYPDGLGLELLTWLQDHLIDDRPGGDVNVNGELLSVLVGLEAVDESDTPTEAQLAKLAEHNDGDAKALWQNVSTGNDWYSYLRSAQGDLTALVKSGFWIGDTDLDKSFGLESLFCEWGYVIDVDNRSFDVYEGFKEEAPKSGLWVGKRGDHEKYYPIDRIAQFSFTELIDWFKDLNIEDVQQRFLDRVMKASRSADEYENADT